MNESGRSSWSASARCLNALEHLAVTSAQRSKGARDAVREDGIIPTIKAPFGFIRCVERADDVWEAVSKGGDEVHSQLRDLTEQLDSAEGAVENAAGYCR